MWSWDTLIYNDLDWTYVNYNFDNFEKDSARVAETLNTTNPDLTAFRKRGGKMILYSGWSDNAQSGLAMAGYCEDLLAHDKAVAEDARLFMMPGVEHCFGGPGPSFVNYLTEIDQWVESGKAPEQVTAYWLDEKIQPSVSRPVCAYPKIAKYDGKGDTRDVTSFSCVDAQ